MKVIAIIQARMGSTRLPGKMMLPLARSHVLYHSINRVSFAQNIDEVLVATSNTKADDIIARYSERFGASVFRGSEEDVLDRIYKASDSADADTVVRITGDCPLISPRVIDAAIDKRQQVGADYCSNTFDRTFPRGLDTEVTTFESLSQVWKTATKPEDREHVTRYYHTNSGQFECVNLSSKEVFDESTLRDRNDLRLTLDEADDYEMLRQIYNNVYFEDILDLREAIEYIDEHDLMRLNKNVTQKSI